MTLKVEQNHWHGISGTTFAELAETYGTPFYLYDANDINERIRNIRSSFKDLVNVYYAVKANPNIEVLRAVQDCADGLDISSGGELEQALLAGFNANTLSFAGPAKTSEELSTSIQNKIGCISIESERELEEIINLAEQMQTRANVVLRVNPKLMIRAFGMKMGGKSVQFGVDEEQIDAVLNLVSNNAKTLNFRGIHIYAGSQCFDIEGAVTGINNTLRIAQEIETNTGLACSLINLGGGFGVSHGESNREMDITALAKALVPIFQAFQESSKQRREIVFELGRFLTAQAGIYVARVISSKESRGKAFYMVDGGLHHHLAAAGTFGSTLRSNYVLRNLSQPNASKVKCSIAGPSCNPTDLLGIDVQLAKPSYGDLIGILKSGSYGLTASPALFLGRKTPAELVRHRGKIILGRQSKSITDFN